MPEPAGADIQRILTQDDAKSLPFPCTDAAQNHARNQERRKNTMNLSYAGYSPPERQRLTRVHVDIYVSPTHTVGTFSREGPGLPGSSSRRHRQPWRKPAVCNVSAFRNSEVAATRTRGVHGRWRVGCTYVWMDTHTSGAINDLDSAALMPKAMARPTPAAAESRLIKQLKKVTSCLRQCCSPSVNMIRLGSTLRSSAKRPTLRMSPRPP